MNEHYSTEIETDHEAKKNLKRTMASKVINLKWSWGLRVVDLKGPLESRFINLKGPFSLVVSLKGSWSLELYI